MEYIHLNKIKNHVLKILLGCLSISSVSIIASPSISSLSTAQIPTVLLTNLGTLLSLQHNQQIYFQMHHNDF